MIKYKHIAFDFDGVVADSAGICAEEINRLRQRYPEIPEVTTQEDFAYIYPGPLRTSLRRFGLTEKMVGEFFDHHSARMMCRARELDYDKFLDFFIEIMGDANPANMKRKDVIRMRDANAAKAYFANYSLRVLRVLMEHCVDLGWRETNPAKGVPELKTVKAEREPWPQQLLDAFRAVCPIGTRERLVMELCVGTGQRIGDVLEMRWSDIQDGAIVVQQNKTNKVLWVPILPELQAALDQASRHSVFILTNERGTNRWSYRGASQAVRKVREQIGALDYDIHSWRYNAACELLEAGCEDDLIAAVTGQSPAMVLHYTKKVRQKIRAIQAQNMRTEQKQNV